MHIRLAQSLKIIYNIITMRSLIAFVLFFFSKRKLLHAATFTYITVYAVSERIPTIKLRRLEH